MKPGSTARTRSAPVFFSKNRSVMIFGIPVERDTIFSTHKGVYKTSIENRQRRLIAKTTLVKSLLQHQESIRCLTTGCSPVGRLGSLLATAGLVCFKRAILVFTDRRILHIPTGFSLRPHSSVSQIKYEDCFDLTLRRRSLIVRYKNGFKEIFAHLGRQEKKKIKHLVAQLPSSPKATDPPQARAYLCPGCANILNSAARCRKCGLTFKTERQAILRSALIPGGGHFYSRHPLLGCVVGFVESLLMAAVGLSCMDVHPTLSMLCWETNFGLLSGSALFLVKLVALSHSRGLIGERMPVRRDFPIRRA